LCLTANDADDMLGVVIEHAVPVPHALIGLCKRCVVAIVKCAMAAEFIQPEEIFGDAPTGAHADPDPGPDPAAAATSDLLVPEAQSDGEKSGVDRPEPKVSAGGQERSGSKSENHE
jgi:hypothetical protein